MRENGFKFTRPVEDKLPEGRHTGPLGTRGHCRSCYRGGEQQGNVASIGGERRGDKWATARPPGVTVRLALLTSAK